jgi:hypothetical protein
MAEIIELRPPETGLDDQIFNAACEMEGDLRAIDGFADALALVSETMDESPHANAINGLAWEIKHRAQRMEARRDNLFTRVLPNSGALLQLVAIDDRASSARHVGDGFFQIHAQPSAIEAPIAAAAPYPG